MTGTGGQEQNPSSSSHVLDVLRRAVSDYGIAVLSNPVILEGVCEDRLPESPREASLISAAARFDVVSIFNQQVPGVGVDAAVRLTANSLAESRSLDPSACQWVVSEFARAMGHEVSAELLSPALEQASPAHRPSPSTINLARLEAPTVPPEPKVADEPAVLPPPPPPPPGAPSRKARRGWTRVLLGVLGGAMGVLIVLVVIGALIGNATPSSTLASYIPSSVSGPSPGTSGSNCAKQKPVSGASAEYDCNTSSTNLPVGFVIYVLFPSSGALDTGYRNVLAHNHVSENAGDDCGRFASFTAPCETGWIYKHTDEGRVVEFRDDSSPAMIFTVASKHLLVGIEGNDGDQVFDWWTNNRWATPSTLS